MSEKKGVHAGWPKGKKRDKPSHTKENRDARGYIIRKIYRNKEALINSQIEAAKGLWYHDAEKGLVFQRKPDVSVGEYLLNQLIGKPKENMEVVGEVELKVDL